MHKRYSVKLVFPALIVCASLFALAACGGPGRAPTRGVYMLIDTSGSYAKEVDKAENIISYILAHLNPGDSIAVARINSASFSENDIVAKATLSSRPSLANQGKVEFNKQVKQFADSVKPAAYTDITGGILQAIGWLNEMDSDQKIILVFSDMKEEIRKGYVRDIDLQLKGFDVIALNVTKLRSDNVDPRKYLGRLAHWKKRVKQGGGHWRVVNDLNRLDNILPPR